MIEITMEENHKISPKSRSKGFPHEEERLIGIIVLDLNPHSIFPQKDAMIMEERDIESSIRSTMED
jgi:hypothetical protein